MVPPWSQGPCDDHLLLHMLHLEIPGHREGAGLRGPPVRGRTQGSEGSVATCSPHTHSAAGFCVGGRTRHALSESLEFVVCVISQLHIWKRYFNFF